MSDYRPGGWLYVSTAELAARIPRDAWMVGADRPWTLCAPTVGTDGYLVVPDLPFYAWHPTFCDNWCERELYRLSSAEHEEQYLT
jgi:hypothetical protein